MASSLVSDCASTGSGSSTYLLPPENLSSVLSSIELLSAMWSGTDELHISTTDEMTIRTLAEFLQLPLSELGKPESQRLKDKIGQEVVLGLNVGGDIGQDTHEGATRQPVKINVGFSLRGKRDNGNGKGNGWRLWTSAKDAPVWLVRERLDEVNAILNSAEVQAEGGEEEEDDMVGQVLNAIEQVSEYLATLPLITATSSMSNASTLPPSVPSMEIANGSTNTSASTTYVLRSWYYLPSLSTKSKRTDICHLALSTTPYPLSGFLLAGKPGLIVLEYPYTPSTPTPSSTQTAEAIRVIDTFWSTIKTTSWSDIPASHKKISEKLNQPVVPKAFDGFHDITDWPEVERSADRGRKSDLSKLIRWLDAKNGINGKWVIERCLGVGSWES